MNIATINLNYEFSINFFYYYFTLFKYRVNISWLLYVEVIEIIIIKFFNVVLVFLLLYVDVTLNKIISSIKQNGTIESYDEFNTSSKWIL